jgi:hypothetical protein
MYTGGDSPRLIDLIPRTDGTAFAAAAAANNNNNNNNNLS